MPRKRTNEIERSPALQPGISVSIHFAKSMAMELYHVCIPHANRILDAHFPHEQTIHPPEAELHKFHALLFQMLGKSGIYAYSQIAQGSDLSMDSWLGIYVVVLDAVKQLGKAPKCISFDSIQHTARQLSRVHAFLDIEIGDIDPQEDLPKRRHQVVDTLHVAASWVSNGPYIQDTLERTLRSLEAI